MNYTDKKTLRKIFMEKRNQLSFDEIHKKSLTICEKFFQTDFYKNSDFIFTYVNYNSEFETSIIIKKAFNDGKRVAVPVMSGNAHEMFFVEIKSFSELSKNKFGILEPELDFEKVLLPNSKTIIIIPALVFDKRGYRIGYGGGFYDKYLSENKEPKAIGLVFDFQIIDEKIVNEKFDIPVNLILSENKKIYI